MKKIIAIDRQFGAAGTTIGQKLAHNLGYEHYDKAIVLHSYQDFDVDISDLVEFDEKAPPNYSFAQSLFDGRGRELSDKIYHAQSATIRKIAESGSCVIIGRNATSIVREFDDALTVFLYAPEYWRIEFMKDRMSNFSTDQIHKILRRVDKARAGYCRHYTKEEFGKPENYDLCIDVAYFGVDGTVGLLTDICK